MHASNSHFIFVKVVNRKILYLAPHCPSILGPQVRIQNQFGCQLSTRTSMPHAWLWMYRPRAIPTTCSKKRFIASVPDCSRRLRASTSGRKWSVRRKTGWSGRGRRSPSCSRSHRCCPNPARKFSTLRSLSYYTIFVFPSSLSIDVGGTIFEGSFT